MPAKKTGGAKRAKKATTKKATTKTATAKKGAAPKRAKKKAVAPRAARFTTERAVAFQAVCDRGDYQGPERARRSDATKDALRHQADTGHIVTVVQLDG